MTFFKKLSGFATTMISTSIFGFGVLVGIIALSVFEKSCNSNFEFVNAAVVCDRPAVVKKTGYIETSNKIRSFIQSEIQAGRVSEVGVYFRDLVNGPVFGINETADFAPASLLKLPLALVYLLQVEKDPNILKTTLSVENPQWSFTETFHPTETINPMEPHSVEDLLMRMIVYSDNNSYGVLQTNIYETGRESEMTQVFLELGFLDPANTQDEIMSVRQYPSIFRALYNVSYLNAQLSEQVLEWLSQSDFKAGLVGGVPENVIVAHKFGERFALDGEKQLHDCGIIYYPENPYLLCVMTKGWDFNNLTGVISSISTQVYDEVDSRRIK